MHADIQVVESRLYLLTGWRLTIQLFAGSQLTASASHRLLAALPQILASKSPVRT